MQFIIQRLSAKNLLKKCASHFIKRVTYRDIIETILPESAKFRALRALVPHVRRAPRALVPYVARTLRALVPHLPRALHALVPYVLRALCTLVLSCLTCSYVSRASCFTCLVLYVASCLTFYEPFFLKYPIVLYLVYSIS